MKERPIIFSTPMVQAILDGRKSMTRRIIKGHGFDPNTMPYHDAATYDDPKLGTQYYFKDEGFGYLGIKCPYGEQGDILWVRESFTPITPSKFNRNTSIYYRADAHPTKLKYFNWKPSIHMPRTAARIFLEITEIRVERLQAITRGDCMLEGCPFPNMADGPNPKDWFTELWNSIKGPDSWDANPWVWVITFRRIDHPITDHKPTDIS